MIYLVEIYVVIHGDMNSRNSLPAHNWNVDKKYDKQKFRQDIRN